MIVGTTALLRPSVGAVRLGRRTSVRQQRFEVTASNGGDRVMFPLYLLEKAYGLPDKWDRVKRTKVCGGCLGT